MAHVEFSSLGNAPNFEISKFAKTPEFEGGNQEDRHSTVTQVMPRDLQRASTVQSR